MTQEEMTLLADLIAKRTAPIVIKQLKKCVLTKVMTSLIAGRLPDCSGLPQTICAQ